MSIIDKMKGAMNSVTGGGATVTLEHSGTFKGGSTITVKVGATSTGAEVKSKGVYIDLRGKKKSTVGQVTGNVVAAANHEFKIGEDFTLAAKESKQFEALVQIPADIDPELDWEIRARIDTFGNDPDSGFKDIR
jgi:hypothetical protein